MTMIELQLPRGTCHNMFLLLVIILALTIHGYANSFLNNILVVREKRESVQGVN